MSRRAPKHNGKRSGACSRGSDAMPRPKLTPKERRERNRLRSERWRRRHGIGPRKPAQRPWLAMGISRGA